MMPTIHDSSSDPNPFRPQSVVSDSDRQRVEKLVRQLTQPSWGFWRTPIKAAKKLGALGVASKGAVPALIGALSDEEPKLAEAAIDALSNIGACAVPALRQALHDDRGDVRANAAWALGHIGPAAREAVPDLIFAAESSGGTRTVRLAVSEACGSIGPAAKEATDQLVAMIKSGDMVLTHSAEQALKKIEADKHKVDSLKRTMLNPARATSTESMNILYMSGNESEIVTVGQAKQNRERRRETAKKLADLGPDAASVLLEALEYSASHESGEFICHDILHALVKTGLDDVENTDRLLAAAHKVKGSTYSRKRPLELAAEAIAVLHRRMRSSSNPTVKR